MTGQRLRDIEYFLRLQKRYYTIRSAGADIGPAAAPAEGLDMPIASLLRPAAMLLAAGVLAGTAAPAQAQMTGTFPVCFANRPARGGVHLMLRLVVVTRRGTGTLSGSVTFTQAVNPPLNVTLPVVGSYNDISRERHGATLSNPPMVGPQVKMGAVFSTLWKAADGAYALWLDTPGGPKKGNFRVFEASCG